MPELIDVGGVDEITAGLGIGVEDRRTVFGVGAMAPAGAEIAGAECDLRNPQTGLSE